jgi:hypothetical protein
MKLSVFDCLTLIFIVLKLIHLIDWSWWWVLAPSWGFFLLCFFVAWIIQAARDA